MKARNIPYGYHYINGTIETHPQESTIVKELFNDYLHGKSLLQISEYLTNHDVEYAPGVTAWNKGKIKRILEDERYLGNEQYPAIISPEIRRSIIQIRDSKNNQKTTNKQAQIFHLNVPVRCPKCNGLMYRRVDNRLVRATKWICKNNNCLQSIAKTDDTFINEIAMLMNDIINNPNIIDIPDKKESNPSIEQIRLYNESSKLFNCAQVDRDQVKTKLLEYASLKYQELDSAVCIARRLKDTFIAASRLTNFCPLLFEKTVDEIKLYTDENIGIILTNKQEIKSGGQYGST